MDPNEALKNARAALARIKRCHDDDVALPAHDLVEAFEALDGWLTNGGFLPAAWECRTHGKYAKRDE